MPNYNEELLTGDIVSWVRTPRVTFEFPYNLTPTVTFDEERLAILPDASVLNLPYIPTGAVSMAFDSPAENLSLVDPETGDSLGEISINQVLIILHSLYLRSAQARDASNI